MYVCLYVFAGLGSVRIVKNCDLGPENVGLEGSIFQDLDHSFSYVSYTYHKIREFRIGHV